MGLEQVIGLLPEAGRLVQDGIAAYTAFQQARAALSETDRVKADAAYETSLLRRQMDELRVLLELTAASQR